MVNVEVFWCAADDEARKLARQHLNELFAKL
jgi:hypothetical protein